MSRDISCKRCKVCDKSIRKENKSGFCNLHYNQYRDRNRKPKMETSQIVQNKNTAQQNTTNNKDTNIKGNLTAQSNTAYNLNKTSEEEPWREKIWN